MAVLWPGNADVSAAFACSPAALQPISSLMIIVFKDYLELNTEGKKDDAHATEGDGHNQDQ
jgi:hypothetical protein